MYCTYIFFLMILCHIIDDFVLQPICLSKLKQQEWWQEECKKSDKADITKYKYDYICALFIHALSWSIMITLPWIIYNLPIHPVIYVIMVVCNTAIHAYVDHQKANKYATTLWIDQICHILQIIVTWSIFVYSVYYNIQ